jgi:hypothetical protein
MTFNLNFHVNALILQITLKLISRDLKCAEVQLSTLGSTKVMITFVIICESNSEIPITSKTFQIHI